MSSCHAINNDELLTGYGRIALYGGVWLLQYGIQKLNRVVGVQLWLYFNVFRKSDL